MILLIDNYDSFSYNLYQFIGEINPDIRVIRNDEMTADEVGRLGASHIVISPGPGKPSDAGICIEVIKKLSGSVPILGICLGHQAIYEAFGGTVSYADRLMHGKSSNVAVVTESPIFKGLPRVIQAARYHSLAGTSATLPQELQIIAQTDDALKEIMGVCHKDYPVYGIQFHPESILTPLGKTIIENFITGER